MEAKDLQIIDGVRPIYPFAPHVDGWDIIPTPSVVEKGIDKHLADIADFETREGDIILCSSMKSGTHWVHEILSMFLKQTTDYNSFGPWWEMNLEYLRQPELVQQIKGPRIFSTHLPYSFLPKTHIENNYKVVYLNRNPKDRYASMRFFFQGKLGVPDWTWDEYFEEIVMKDKLYTGWLNYTKEMTSISRSKPDAVFSVMYEDLLLEPKKHYTDLAKFLGLSLSEEFIDKVIEKCSFSNLKGNKMDVSMLIEGAEKASLFRKGKIGDWKNYFTVAQNERLDAIYAEEMKGVDVNFIYE